MGFRSVMSVETATADGAEVRAAELCSAPLPCVGSHRRAQSSSLRGRLSCSAALPDLSPCHPLRLAAPRPVAAAAVMS